MSVFHGNGQSQPEQRDRHLGAVRGDAHRATPRSTRKGQDRHARRRGGVPAQFIGIVYDQPNEQAAIERAIEEFKVLANQRDRLIAQPRD